MSVGILLVTHPGIGPALRDTAEALLKRLPLAVGCCEVGFDDLPADVLLANASAAMRGVDQGDGVLLLSDLYGASPANLAARLAQLGTPVRRVAGLNLSMLLRTLNYAEQSLDELTETAAAGGRNGVIRGDA